MHRGPLFILCISLLASCASGFGRAVILGPTPEYREKPGIIELVDHENAAKRPAADIPEWVTRYVSTGISGIEDMPNYAAWYVFIGKQGGNSLEALKLWAGNFSVDRDFSRLVVARILDRFTRVGGGNPGEEFGRYFDGVIKNAADTSFSGAVQEASFWVKKRILDDGGLSPAEETFEYYILVKIPKETLQKQIDMILITTRPDLRPTREQAAAATRLKPVFYNGF